jgi:outer membrane murein-binding lipoprotein Lpp
MKIQNKKVMWLQLALVGVILLALAGGITSYVLNEQKKEYIVQSQAAIAAQEQYITSVFDRIESNLAKIREKESMIQQKFPQPDDLSSLGPEERIQSEIDFIEFLLEENDSLIASLNDQIREKDSRLGKYASTVKDLKSKVAAYQVEVEQLIAQKDALQRDLDENIKAKDRLTARVDTLGRTVTEKSMVINKQQRLIADKDSAMSTAYYVVGTYKSLRDKSVIEKEGGVLGINRVIELVSNPDEKQFHQIDTREVMQIPVNAKRWELVTGQDPSSYDILYKDDLAQWISITDPQKFWEKSKYLVIVVRDNENGELAESR